MILGTIKADNNMDVPRTAQKALKWKRKWPVLTGDWPQEDTRLACGSEVWS
jgi:hypothetical protein